MKALPARGRMLSVAALGSLLLASSVAVAAPSGAAKGHFNTNAYTTGCAKSSYVLSSRAVSGGTARIMVSRSCGTNWIEYVGKVQTSTKAGKDFGTNKWTRTEVDKLGHAASMQSYAPGTTKYTAYVKIGATTTSATCTNTCTWSVSTPPPPKPPVTSTKATRAVNWARTKVGSNAYPGLCELFVENAYGTSGRYYDAMTAYNSLRAAGQMKTSRTNIPAGALVFSKGPLDLGHGHVMLSEGGGKFISGGMANGATVQRVSTPNPGNTFLGWAMPPSSWPGR